MTSAPMRDDDPVHPDLDGIVFYPTTDRTGIVVTAALGSGKPPITFLSLTAASIVADDIGALIRQIRARDKGSYLADYLDLMLDDFAAAIMACRESSH